MLLHSSTFVTSPFSLLIFVYVWVSLYQFHPLPPSWLYFFTSLKSPITAWHSPPHPTPPPAFPTFHNTLYMILALMSPTLSRSCSVVKHYWVIFPSSFLQYDHTFKKLLFLYFFFITRDVNIRFVWRFIAAMKFSASKFFFWGGAFRKIAKSVY